MNCIPALKAGALLLVGMIGTACNAQVADPEPQPASLVYDVRFDVEPDPAGGSLHVEMKVSQPRALLRELRMRPDNRVRDVRADGELREDQNGIVWQPPARGGTLSWHVDVAHRRNGDGFDAWLGVDWGLFRAEDIIPRAATRTLKGASSETSLRFDLPAGWSAVTEYFEDGGEFRVRNPARRFDQPAGWIVIGNLGVRRETIAKMRVAVAGPTKQGVRRLDTLALLRWTLPELARILPELPPRLTIVSAGEPMWRGGLSAPQSIFLHSKRPLISENATSTLLHEVMHMALGLDASDGYDWIVEGLAEYYSLQLLVRSGSISTERYVQANQQIAAWAMSADQLCGPASSGATTALAVTVFEELQSEIAAIGPDPHDLDDVLVALTRRDGDVDLATLVDTVEVITGSKPDALHIDNLPGCRTLGAAVDGT